MSSTAFDRFQTNFLGDGSEAARDRLDTEALTELVGDERERAEDLLIARLPEIRAVIGLGVLRSRKAEPELKKEFATERPLLSWELIALAEALWRIQPDRRWVEAEIDALQHAGSEERRQGAAEALGRFRDPEAARALTKAMDAPEPFIRYHAARSLLRMHGERIDIYDPKHPMPRVMSEDQAKRDAAKADILAMVAGKPLAPP